MRRIGQIIVAALVIARAGSAWADSYDWSPVAMTGVLNPGNLCTSDGVLINCSTSTINLASQVTGYLSVVNGGTGANTASAAVSNLLSSPLSGVYQLSCDGSACTPISVADGSGIVNSGVQYQMAYYAADGAAVSGNPYIYTNAANDLLVTNGKIGIGTTSPVSSLHVATGGLFAVTGTYQSGDRLPAGLTGSGVRMVFYPYKAAFRAGLVTGTHWDDGNIGYISTAFGDNVTASGNYSAAFGNSTVASGGYSAALGYYSTASGSVATAIGHGAVATAYSDFAIGQYNVAGGTQDSWVLTDPIFEIGIGTSSSDRANAVTVLKNGNFGIGTTTPTSALDVRGGVTIAGGNTNANAYTSSNFGLVGGYTSPVSGRLIFGNNTGMKFNVSRGTAASPVDLFTFTDQGRLGIGTTFPANALDIGSGQGIHIEAGTPGSTAEALYNVGGVLYWNGSIVSIGGSGTVAGAPGYIPIFTDATTIGNSAMYQNGSAIGIGTTTPTTTLTVYNTSQSATLTNFTQDVANAGINIVTGWTDGAYTPGLFWSTEASNNTKPKAGIWMYEAGAGSMLQFGTSNNYATGITNTALSIDQSGKVGIGSSAPAATLDVVSAATTGNGFTVGASGLTTGAASTLYSSSTAGGASGTSHLLKLVRSGANANATHTAYGLHSAVTNTGTTNTNVAGYFSASGATSNYGVIVDGGYVGIGSTSPVQPLDILASTGSGAIKAAANLYTSGAMVDFSSTSQFGAASNSTYVTKITRSGANGNASHTAYGLHSTVTNTGTSAINVAGYFSASGGTSNIGLMVPAGVVAIGTTVAAGTVNLVTTASVSTGLNLTANQLTTGAASTYTSTATTGAASGASYMQKLLRSGANANDSHTAYGLYSTVINSGTNASNVAGYFSASGATNNYGLIVAEGNVGIGTTAPASAMHVATGGLFAVTGTVGSGDTLPSALTGQGTRMFFYPLKAAFRAGYTSNNWWDDASIGNYSAAMGYGSKASSTASSAFGYLTSATGANSTATGNQTTASGNASAAFGQYTTASSLAAMSIGQYNVGGGTAGSWVAADPIFEIGIGTAGAAANALTVLKNGNVGIGTTSPSNKLDVYAGGIHIGSDTPSLTTDALYNIGGTLYWNGSAVSTGAGSGTVNSGTQYQMTYYAATGAAVSGHSSITTDASNNFFVSGGGISVGTTAAPGTSLKVHNNNASTTLADFTQGLTKAGINIVTDYTAGAYTPGVFWSTASSDATMPKAGVWMHETADGSELLFGTSGTYASGITNTMVYDYTGRLGIGTATPAYNVAFGSPGSKLGTYADATHNASVELYNSSTGNINFQTTTSGSSGNFTFTNTGGQGWVGIGTDTPVSSLQVATGGLFSVTGTYGSGETLPSGLAGASSRMVFYPRKSAFRAGLAQGTTWDDANIGVVSVAMGLNTTASGNYSTALGGSTTASGTHSTAMNGYSTASGSYSTSMGYNTTAASYEAVALGQYNVGGGTPTSWVATDPIFEIGIGTDASNKANAVTVLKNGNVGIGTTAPVSALHVGSGVLAVTGTYNGTDTLPSGLSGQGARLLFYPGKAALRGGYASGSQWDDENIAGYSVALGASTKANGAGSTAFGNWTIASGSISTAMGRETTASGRYTTSMGYGTTATAHSDTAIGQFNVGGGTTDSWVSTEPIFEIGIGADSSNKANAVTVLKNGNVGIGTTSPLNKLDVYAGGIHIGSDTPSLTTDALYNVGGTLYWNGSALNSGGSGTVSGTANYIPVFTGTNVIGNSVLYQSSSNVGIGTTSPATALQVAGTTSTGNGNYESVFIGPAGAAALNYSMGYVGFNAGRSGTNWTLKTDSAHNGGSAIMGDISGNMYFLGSSSNTPTADQTLTDASFFSKLRLTISNWGGVGIGTSDPVAMLHIHNGSSGQTPNTNTGLLIENNGADNTDAALQVATYGGGKSFIVTDAGNIGIGTDAPVSSLQVASGGLLSVTGTYGAGATLPAGLTGAGTRMFFYPRKAAFRAGDVAGTQWDDANIGDYSVAFGEATRASGGNSVAMGDYSTASGYASVAMGYGAIASGAHGVAMGDYTTAASYDDFAIGAYNVGGGTAGSWVLTDPIFEIGIGTSSGAKANAVTVLKSGKVGIGTTAPVSSLHVATGGLLSVTGTFGAGDILPAGLTGTGVRAFFYPRKGAFRAGYAYSTYWDDSSIGNYSTAFGYMSKATAFGSVAMGEGSIADSEASTAMGEYTTASYEAATAMGVGTLADGYASTSMGEYSATTGGASTAMGSFTTASGYGATAMGTFTTAIGDYSTAMGDSATADSYASVALGSYNVGGGTAGSWVLTDPIFEIGIGTSSGAKANAVTVLKNGFVGIGTTSPANGLDVYANGIHLQSSVPTSTSNALYASGSALYWNGSALSVGASGNVNSGTQYQMAYYAATGAAVSGESGITTDASHNLLASAGLSVGTTSAPASSLTVYNTNQSLTLTDFTEALTKAGINIVTGYTASAYTPGLFWSNSDNNSTKPKAGIWMYETGGGSFLQFGTSESYVTGINHVGLTVDPSGEVGIGSTNPAASLDVYSTATTGSAVAVTGNAVTTGNALSVAANALTTGAVGSLSSTSTAGGASGASFVQKLARSGANANSSHTAYGLYSTVANTGTGSTNVAGYFSASGGASNYGLLVPNGYVGIGTTIPGGTLDLRGAYKAPSTGNALAYLYSMDTQSANVGGSLGFGGQDGTISDRAFGIIGGFKENSTSGNYAGYLSFSTRANGTVPAEAMRISSAGSVGIGTTNPWYTLDVRGQYLGVGLNGTASTAIEVGESATGDHSAYIDLTGDSTYTDYGLRLLRNGGANASSELTNRGTGTLTIKTYEAGPIAFSTTNAERMRISATGYVGIGTTSPTNAIDINLAQGIRIAAGTPTSTTNALYNVGGALYFNGSAVSAGGGVGGSGSTNYIPKFTAASTLGNSVMIQDASDYIGIGTATPRTKLHAYGTITGGTDSTGGSTILQGYYWSTGATAIWGAERSSGAPVMGHDVAPDTASAGSFLSTIGTESHRAALTVGGGAGSIRFFTGPAQTVAIGSSVTMTQKMILNNDGYLGIGTASATSPLTLGVTASNSIPSIAVTNGTVTWGGITGTGPDFQFGTLTNHRMFLLSNNTVRMTIGTTGNIGIGSTVPAATLDVLSAATTGSAVDILASSVTTGFGQTVIANALTTGTASYVASSSTAGGASGASYLQRLVRSGANANASHTAYGLYSTVANTGTTNTNVAGYFGASGATNNYGLIVAGGDVGIGTAAPGRLLHVYSAGAQYSYTTAMVESGAADGKAALFLKNSGQTWQILNNGAASNSLMIYDAANDKWPLTIGAGTLNNTIVTNSSGNVGIGTTSPVSSLHVATGGLLAVTGTFGSGDTLPAGLTGAGTRMVFYPRKGAFRAGVVASTEWDDANIGGYSFATGLSSRASGSYGIAMGDGAVAGGAWSFAAGAAPAAIGSASVALGKETSAGAFATTAIGQYNVGGGTAGSWVLSDSIFEIGIGTSLGARSNAMTVLKSGNVGVGTTTPSHKLDVYSATGAAELYVATGATGTYPGIQIVSGNSDYNPYLSFIGNETNLASVWADIGSVSLGFNVNSSPRMVINSNGYVGIGTSTAANALDVNVAQGIRLAAGTPTSTSNALYNVGGTLYWNGSAVGSGSGTVTSGTQYQMAYYAANGTAVSGNSAITTDASNNLNLTKALTTTQAISATSTDGIVLQNTTAAIAGNQKWSPRLHFSGRGWKTDATAASQTVDVIAELQPVQGAANPSGSLVWSSSINGTSYTPLMTLTTGGYLGIGSATPQGPLDILSNSSIVRVNKDYGHILFRNSASTNAYWAIAPRSTGSFDIAFSTTDPGTGYIGTTGTLLSISSAGNVTIGTQSGAQMLTTYDTPAKTTSYTSAYHYAGNTSSTDATNKIALQIESSGTWSGASATNTGLRVNVSGGTANYSATFLGGNVGIGTTTPQATLDVNGFAKLKLNSSAPVTCAAAYQGSLALTHLARMCVCDTTNVWSDVVTGAACAW
jgi:hypothetical protein